ncbi:hypothetical protein ABW19_dt0207090 [Dactylella cylindrospora]|nr:hypothetical protein ABW19_dt0207090 [Dactylella cylindrospora]
MPSQYAYKRKSWLRRKLLWFEVHFCPYVLTPGEKTAFYTFLFLFLGLLTAAVALYLPQHLQTVARRAYFYLYGDESVIRQVDVLEYSSFEMRNAGVGYPGFSSGRQGDVKTYIEG